MEYTKDIMYHIKYEQDENVLRINNEKRNTNIFALLKKHKFITGIVIVGIFFIITDVVLINNFINLLK